MAVDLSTLVDPLKGQVSPPGTDLFPEATDDSYLSALISAFWEIRLYRMLNGFEENAAARNGPPTFTEGIVTPLGVLDDTYDDPTGYATDQDLGRDLQQLIVLWAGYRIVLNRMSSLNTVFRAKAGPVEYETQNAASVLKTVLDQLKYQIDAIIKAASQYSTTAMLDSVIERSYSQAVGESWWVR